MNRDWLDQYKGVEYLKNKKERDWKFIIGMIVLLAIFAVMGGAFWNMVGRAERGSKCYFCNLYRDRRISEDRSFCGSEQWNYFQRRHTGRGHLQ